MNSRSPKAEQSRRRGAVPKPTGAQVVYEALRQAIISLRLVPGAPLEELDLCRTYRMSRTPVREALIRLASEDLVELEPNRGAKVAALQFIDVVDHYEAMDVFQPVIAHFASIRRTDDDIAALETCLANFRSALTQKDPNALILANFTLHCAVAASCHNRSLEKAYRRMVVDKLRLAQHSARSSKGAEHNFARRFEKTFQLSEALVSAINSGDTGGAEKAASELNAYIRTQVIDILSSSLGAMTKPKRSRLKAIQI